MLTRLVLLLTALFASTSILRAQPGGDLHGHLVETNVLSGWRSGDGTHTAGIEIRLAPGWKTYWRSPGDAGIPPLFNWSGSKNLNKVSVSWPTPEIFLLYGSRTFGYENRVILPIAVIPSRQSETVHLSGVINLGICRDVCVPVQVEIDGTLRASSTQPDPAIAAAIADQPSAANEAGLKGVSCSLKPAQDGISLTVKFVLPATGGKEVTILETNDPTIWVSESKSERRGELLTSQFDLVHSSGGPFALNRSDLRFTILGSKRAVDIQGCSS